MTPAEQTFEEWWALAEKRELWPEELDLLDEPGGLLEWEDELIGS